MGLTTLFNDIADAIREKDGSSEPIVANDFADRIRAIPTNNLPDDIYEINIQANDPARGTVSGGGIASKGMEIIVTCKENEGYSFVNWSEDCENVCDTNKWTFIVDHNTNLIANFVKTRLPSGYKELEYIQNSGTTSKIDTGYTLNFATSKLIMDIEVPNNTMYMKEYFFGCTNFTMSNQFYLYRPNDEALLFAFYGGTAQTVYKDVSNSRFTIQYDGPNKKFSIGDTNFSITTSNTKTTSTLKLFNYQGMNGTEGIPQGKLYSLQFYENNVLVRDFVPCLDASNSIKLYDLINNTALSISGFKAGPEK